MLFIPVRAGKIPHALEEIIIRCQYCRVFCNCLKSPAAF
jgi:hypothetical protein